jgi:di/tripeptidase
MKPISYIRRVAEQADINVKLADVNEMNKLTLAINRYGNNLNQIAKVANASGSINKTDIQDIQEDWRRIKKMVSDFFKDFEYTHINQ